MTCTGCSALLEPGWRYCPECGIEREQALLGEEMADSICFGLLKDKDGNPIQWRHLDDASLTTRDLQAIEQLIRETGCR